MPIVKVSTDISRADARRNRAKVLAAAQAAFAGQGMSVSLSEVARRAGVGAGTVYRHFPTKEVLLEAVLSHRIERLTRLAIEAEAAPEPGRAFLDLVVEIVTSTPMNREMCELLDGEDGWPRAVLLSSGQRFRGALATSLDSAQRAGVIRPDIDLTTVLTIFTGCVAMQRTQPDPRRMAPASALLIDSMRQPSAVTNPTAPDGDRDESELPDRHVRTPADDHRVCDSCGTAITHHGPGRPPRFCSPACRQRAYRRRLRAAG